MPDGLAPGSAPPAAPAGASPPEGLKAVARMQMVAALDLLQKALPVLGSVSEEGRAILSALKALAGAIPKETREAAGSQPMPRPAMPQQAPQGPMGSMQAPMAQMLGGGM